MLRYDGVFTELLGRAHLWIPNFCSESSLSAARDDGVSPCHSDEFFNPASITPHSVSMYMY